MTRFRPVALLLVIAACAPAHKSGTPSPVTYSTKRELTEQEQIAHVLSRLTFGARPGDAERVKAMGVDKWIAQQLRPNEITDTILTDVLSVIPVWWKPTSEVTMMQAMEIPVAIRPADTTKKGVPAPAPTRIFRLVGANQFLAGKLFHAQLGEQQLREVITDFWANHFSVFTGKMPSQEAIVAWERDVIRPNAMGKFRDLLAATASSPAMLHYLDNRLSRKGAINENYAREIMELHTLGVDGGYTQQDVINVAKAFTGWTLQTAPRQSPDRPAQFSFVFIPAQHDSSEKTVLGYTLGSGRGVADAIDVLDILARHPSTAKYISFKLVRRLVSDDPPPSLVARVAETFTKTDGDITEVVRTIVTSPEFFSRAAFRAKTKTPFELVVSARRALQSPPDTSNAVPAILTQHGQQIFGRQTPDGWPDVGSAWLNAGTVMKRIVLGADIAAGRQAGFATHKWSGWEALSSQATPDQVDGLLKMMFGGYVDEDTRRALLANKYESTDGRGRLTEMLAMVLGSPEFQKR